MPNIKQESIEKYNNLIRNNGRATRRLEEKFEFPLLRFDIILSPFSKKDYSNLIDWSGEKNAMYFLRCLSEFYKNWIFMNYKNVVPVSSLDKNKKSDKLILDISDCFEVQNVKIKTMAFFETLKKEPYLNDLEGVAHLKQYGKTTIPVSELGLKNTSNLELSIVGNWIALR